MIKQSKGKYTLVSKSGKKLGTHDTKEEAVAQEHAVNISKARAAGHRIPKKKK